MGTKRQVPVREHLSRNNLLLKGIPAEYVDSTLDDYKSDNEIKKIVTRFVEEIHTMYEDRVCLCFYGSNGTGKTFLASIIVKEAYRHRYTSHITTMAHYMDLCYTPAKTKEIEEELYYIRNAEFLVIDEVGKEQFTASGGNVTLFEELLRNAVANGNIIIICSNLPLEDAGGKQGLYSLYGKSVRSLVEGDFVKVKFNQSDYRHNIMNKKKGFSILKGEL